MVFRKPKLSFQFQLKLAMDMEGSKKSFYCYMSSKIQKQRKGGLTTEWSRCCNDSRADQAEGLNAFFASVFTDMVSQIFVPRDKIQEESCISWESLINGTCGMDLRMTRKLTDIIARPLCIVFERLWRSDNATDSCRKANVAAIFREDQMVYPGSFR